MLRQKSVYKFSEKSFLSADPNQLLEVGIFFITVFLRIDQIEDYNNDNLVYVRQLEA